MPNTDTLSITAHRPGPPDERSDAEAHAIFEAVGGKWLGQGTYVGDEICERDIEYAVPVAGVSAVRAALRAAGWQVT